MAAFNLNEISKVNISSLNKAYLKAANKMKMLVDKLQYAGQAVGNESRAISFQLKTDRVSNFVYRLGVRRNSLGCENF